MLFSDSHGKAKHMSCCESVNCRLGFLFLAKLHLLCFSAVVAHLLHHGVPSEMLFYIP